MTKQERQDKAIKMYQMFLHKSAHECAIRAIDEIIIALKFTNDSKWYVEQHEYWQQIKKEIEKL